MTRYLLDTNIFIYRATDFDSLNNDVQMALNEPDAQLFISSASVMEMVVGYNNKSFDTRRWKSTSLPLPSFAPTLPRVIRTLLTT